MSDLISEVKSIYGNLMSYNCRRKSKKKSKLLLPERRLRRYFIHKDLLPYNKTSHLKQVNHLFFKAIKKLKYRLFLHQLGHIHEFYDLFDDWDEIYDSYWEDLEIELTHDLVEEHLLSTQYNLSEKNLNKNNDYTQNYLLRCKLSDYITRKYEKDHSDYYDHSTSLKLLFLQVSHLILQFNKHD